jgi:hypothetical protein
MDDVLRYEGTRALVTGAASGMGAATASMTRTAAEVQFSDLGPGAGLLRRLGV